MILLREKQLEYFKHQLLVKRIIWEKLGFSLILLFFGTLGGFLGKKALENHRGELLKEQFLLENRMTSLINIRSEYSKVILLLGKCVRDLQNDTLPKDYYESYGKMLGNLAFKINTEGFLLSHECTRKMQTHISILVGLRKHGIHQAKKYIGFLMDVSSDFDSILKNEFWQTKNDSIYEFKFSNKTREEVIKMGEEVFFDEEYERWRKWKQKI